MSREDRHLIICLRALPALNSASTRNDNFAILPSPCLRQPDIHFGAAINLGFGSRCLQGRRYCPQLFPPESNPALPSAHRVHARQKQRQDHHGNATSIRARQSGDSKPSARLIKSFTISSARPSLTASAINKTDAASSGLG